MPIALSIPRHCLAGARHVDLVAFSGPGRRVVGSERPRSMKNDAVHRRLTCETRDETGRDGGGVEEGENKSTYLRYLHVGTHVLVNIVGGTVASRREEVG